MQNLTQHPDTWSNIIFIAPIIAAFYYGLNYLGIVGLVGIATSSLYHYYDEKKFYFADHFVSLTLLLWSIWLVWQGKFEPASLFYALLVSIILSAYFFVASNRSKSEILHGYWHLSVSAVGFLSILIFVS